jgi:iron(III) transport system ATP-binding protein
MIAVEIKKLNKLFKTKEGGVQALRDVDLRVEPGEFCVLLGPSGSGKTTALRCIAGLEKPDSGEIMLGDRVVFAGKGKKVVPPEDRELGMVFQSYAIWPHMTVYQNVALPLTQGKGKIPKKMVRERVQAALHRVQMDGYEERPAPMLSGGQQQRVALARAFAINPKALLMDEPLSNLDARLRESVRVELRGLVKELGITVLYVTHDQIEAMALADRIALMDDGEIVQLAVPRDMYYQPATTMAAEFFGSMNWLEGVVQEPGLLQTDMGPMRVEAEYIGGLNVDLSDWTGNRVFIGVRPEDIHITPSTTGKVNEFAGEVLDSIFLGDCCLCRLESGTQRMVVKSVETGDLRGKVYFSIRKFSVFPKAEG